MRERTTSFGPFAQVCSWTSRLSRGLRRLRLRPSAQEASDLQLQPLLRIRMKAPQPRSRSRSRCRVTGRLMDESRNGLGEARVRVGNAKDSHFTSIGEATDCFPTKGKGPFIGEVLGFGSVRKDIRLATKTVQQSLSTPQRALAASWDDLQLSCDTKGAPPCAALKHVEHIPFCDTETESP